MTKVFFANIKGLMNTLKEHMAKYNLTLLDVARMSGVPKPTVYAHYSGIRNIGAKSAIKYSRGLGIGVERLLASEERDN